MVLSSAEPAAKIMAARWAARQWRLGRLAHIFDVAMPERPARPDKPELLPPNKMPRRGKGDSVKARSNLLHALAHIEFSAIDLAFDLIGRFGAQFPAQFVSDWMRVGADEAMHFAILDRRLKQLGSYYGDMPAHDGLWEAAHDTRHDALARLAVVPMVLEARGLDITPATVTRFESQNDMASARILNRIYHDEIKHVGYGTHWFRHGCQEQSFAAVQHWQMLVKRHFRGGLKAPFNDSARATAGLTQDYYAALAT
ncbi:ferritin-like domain-containing protein [Parasphingorhabdus sp. DH2-15]|uniref:ferritin-like domain-containing protein n=1 Tax=Parasphingorhabdus sp. DH2-15 TaxID=3444112 RepID=UPI003F68523D